MLIYFTFLAIGNFHTINVHNRDNRQKVKNCMAAGQSPQSFC